MSKDTTLLFGLEGVKVVSVELDGEANPLLSLVTADEGARCCPGCGVRSAHPHSWVRTRPRDLPIAARRTALTWTRRRWRCGNPACARRTFTESVPQIPPRSRLTGRLREAVGTAVSDQGRTVIQAARDFEVSWPVAHAAFAARAEAELPRETPTVARLGIDEIRRGKARFRLTPGDNGDTWEVVADRWHVGFTDLADRQGLVGQVEGRTAASVSAWTDAQSPAWRAGVQVVAIDMCTVFKAAVRASPPEATLVVDRFHVAPLANAALTEIRRRVTVQQRGRRGRKGNREWELRNRLTRAGARMHWQPPFPPGGPRYSPRSRRAPRTLAPRAPTASSRPTHAAPSATATPPTSACAPAAPPPAAPADTLPPEPADATPSLGSDQRAEPLSGPGCRYHRHVTLRFFMFDLGGVVCRYHRDRRIGLLATSCGTSAEQVESIIYGSGLDAAWDGGGHSAQDVEQELRRQLGFTGTAHELHEIWCSAFEPDPDVLATVDLVRPHRTALLTDNDPLLLAAFPEHLADVHRRFDALAFSCVLGATKPAPEAFAAALALIGAAPHETFFVDDRETNVRAARQAGINAVLFEGSDKLRHDLATAAD